MAQPIYRGGIQSWEDMEDLWEYIFTNELRVSSENQACLVTETPLNPKADREKTTEIFFEKFGVPALYIGNQGALSVYTSGVLSGLVLESGEAVTHAIPVYQGFALPHATLKLNLGGMDLTEYLSQLMELRYHTTYRSLAQRDMLTDLKETLCYVAIDYRQEYALSNQESSLEANYRLPDDTVITVGKERFKCGEALFQPAMMGRRTEGLHELVFSAVMKTAVDVRPILLKSVVLAGGNTLFRGFDERLSKELGFVTTEEVHVVAKPERKFSVWIGGSILSSLSTFQQMWIPRSDFDEYGPTVVHRYCF